MNPRHKLSASELLDAPPLERRARLGPLQIGALVFFGLFPLLALFGVFGGRANAAESREAIWRVVFVYVFLMVAFRLMGKREVGLMSPLELVTLMMIPEIFSAALNRNSPSLMLATISVATLFLVVFLSGLLKFNVPKADRFLEGGPTILVQDGEFVAANMQRERVTPDEILAEMHLAGLERLAQVRWAILETEGKIAIIPNVSERAD